MTDYNNNLCSCNCFINSFYLPKKGINKKQLNYFNIACDLACKSNMYKNYGAVLVYNNKIIGKGHNHSIDYISKYNNFMPTKFKCLQNVHAEEDAIYNSIKNGYKKILHKCVMYIVRIENTINDIREDIQYFRQSVPCDKCKKLIIKYNIKKAYYIVD